MAFADLPFLGFGVGLRGQYAQHFTHGRPDGIDWVEAITEVYLPWEDGTWVKPIEFLEKVRSHLPIALHGVSLSIGSSDPLDKNYMARWKQLIDRIQPEWVSDHLCWTGHSAHNVHDLLPLPYTREALRHLSDRISQVQDFLGRKMLIENVSSYVEFDHGDYSEWEFLAELTQRSGCGLLLDVNNVYVSSVNHGFDPWKYLSAIPKDAVGQIHLAGHRNKGTYCIDTHDEPVCDEVWKLYGRVAEWLGPVTTMIERDDRFPEWAELKAEVDKARQLATGTHDRPRSQEITATL